MAPNVFDYATSELSQDAFLAWLFSWADDNKYCQSELNRCSKNVLNLFCGTRLRRITDVNVFTQLKKIDILLQFNENKFLLIEDKTDTEQHDGQLERYKAAMEEICDEKNIEYNEDNIYYAYYKTGEITPEERNFVEECGYRIITKQDILEKLLNCRTRNAFFRDYIVMLQRKIELHNGIYENSLEEIMNIEDQECRNPLVVEFFSNISNELNSRENGLLSGWNFVNSPNNHRYVMWFGWFDIPRSCSIYCELDEFKMKIKMSDLRNIRGENTVANRRESFTNRLINQAEQDNNFRGFLTPNNMGSNDRKTIPLVDVASEVWLTTDEDSGRINFEQTIEKIKRVIRFVERFVSQLNQ